MLTTALPTGAPTATTAVLLLGTAVVARVWRSPPAVLGPVRVHSPPSPPMTGDSHGL